MDTILTYTMDVRAVEISDHASLPDGWYLEMITDFAGIKRHELLGPIDFDKLAMAKTIVIDEMEEQTKGMIAMASQGFVNGNYTIKPSEG